MENIKRYLKEISKHPLLTPEEEIEVAKKVQKGDQEAKKKMINSNLRFVVHIAKRYDKLGIPLDDLIDEGNIGLMNGVDNFDPSKGFRFLTFAAPHIKGKIIQLIENEGIIVRSDYSAKESQKFKNAREKCFKNFEREPTFDEIANEMNNQRRKNGKNKISVEKVKKIYLFNLAQTISLDTKVSDSSNENTEKTLEDTLECPKSSKEEIYRELDKYFEKSSDKKKADGVLDNLNEREKKILDLRFGLSGGSVKTLEEVGKILGISKVRVGQIEKNLIKKIRNVIKQRAFNNKNNDNSGENSE